MSDTQNEQKPPESGNEFLNVKQVAEAVGMNERLLRTYLDEPVTRAHLEATGDKAPRYPKRALPKFERIKELAASKTTSPKTLARQIERGLDLATLTPLGSVPRSEEPPQESGNASMLPVLPPQAEALIARIVSEAVEQVSARALPAPADVLIDTNEAAAMLGISASSFRRRVEAWGLLPVRFGRATRWSREEVRALVDRLKRERSPLPEITARSPNREEIA